MREQHRKPAQLAVKRLEHIGHRPVAIRQPGAAFGELRLELRETGVEEDVVRRVALRLRDEIGVVHVERDDRARPRGLDERAMVGTRRSRLNQTTVVASVEAARCSDTLASYPCGRAAERPYSGQRRSAPR